jgi:hypothetical protein
VQPPAQWLFVLDLVRADPLANRVGLAFVQASSMGVERFE